MPAVDPANDFIRRAVVAPPQPAGRLRISHLELYDARLVIRFIIPDGVMVRDTRISADDREQFIVSDDRGTTYTSHGTSIYGSGSELIKYGCASVQPAPPAAAQRLDIETHAGRVVFDLTKFTTASPDHLWRPAEPDPPGPRFEATFVSSGARKMKRADHVEFNFNMASEMSLSTLADEFDTDVNPNAIASGIANSYSWHQRRAIRKAVLDGIAERASNPPDPPSDGDMVVCGELEAVMIAPDQPSEGVRILAVERYSDGLIVRSVKDMDDPINDLVRDVRDDVGTTYTPVGDGGGSHGVNQRDTRFSPAVPIDAKKLIVQTMLRVFEFRLS